MKAMKRVRAAIRSAASISSVLLAALGVWVLPGGVSEARGQEVRGQEARALTLEESVRLGLEHNGTLRAAVADAAAADAARRRVRADQLPALRSQASYTRLSDNIPGVEFTLPGTDSTVTFQAVELNRFHSEVSVELPLLTQLRLRHASLAAAHEAEAAELTVDQERSDVAYRTRRAYWELYRAEAVRGRIDVAIAQVDTHLAEVRARLQEGAVLPRDVLAAQTRRSEVRLERVEAENAVQVARLELNRLIGLPLDSPVRAASEVELDEPELAVGVPSAEAVEERPEIGALTEQVWSYRERLLAAEAARIPDVDFVGRYVYSRPNPYFFQEQADFRGTWELMLSARWGIWEGGRLAARQGEARAQLEAAEARLAATREQVAVDVARLRLEVERAMEAMGVAAQNVAEAEESYRVVRQQFAEGAALSGDVLDAEEALRRAHAREVQARTDYAIARAAVLNALGRVW